MNKPVKYMFYHYYELYVTVLLYFHTAGSAMGLFIPATQHTSEKFTVLQPSDRHNVTR
jgi:hypothetical protein